VFPAASPCVSRAHFARRRHNIRNHWRNHPPACRPQLIPVEISLPWAISVTCSRSNNNSPPTGSACAFGSCWPGTYKLTIPGQQAATGTWAGKLGASLAFAASGAADSSKEVISLERCHSIRGMGSTPLTRSHELRSHCRSHHGQYTAGTRSRLTTLCCALTPPRLPCRTRDVETQDHCVAILRRPR